MKDRLYGFLVHRTPGIRDRYCKAREEGRGRLYRLLLLLWLHVRYYIFLDRRLARPLRFPYYEEKVLCRGGSESALAGRESPKIFASRLAAFDVVSFDVFDTLLFRPFSQPADLFYLIGRRLGYPDFKSIRVRAEARAREKKRREAGTGEVTLAEIWAELEVCAGIPRQTGMEAEWEEERRCCFANPYMLEVVAELRRRGKRILAVSDMYLGEAYIRKLLEDCGYGELDGCFVSCDYGASKGDGRLYRIIRERLGRGLSFAHVGDNPRSDREQAAANGFRPFFYPNINLSGSRFRAEDLSAVTGSVYRGLVNAHLYSGLNVYSKEYEYGFVFGGLFAVGYCRFIHRIAQERGVDRLLFLSRDGAALLEAYRRMYPEDRERTVYAYWSRMAAVKLTASYFKREYFRRFIEHKADGRFTLRQILESMELIRLLPDLCRTLGVDDRTPLTYKNAEDVKSYLLDRWEEVLRLYRPQVTAAGNYYRRLLSGCRRAAAVDVGWAGSGAVMLDYAVNRLWGMDCPVTGILAGTNACDNPEADAGEPFFLDGRLVSYLFSQGENRDLWKFHDAARGHNLYWELLLGADEGSLRGFYPDGESGYVCRFGEPPSHAASIREIHRGLLDFVELFLRAEARMGVRLPVSGRDAYAPMISVCSKKNKRFRKGLEALLDDAHIG